MRRIIINELNEVAKKYAQPRRSEILYDLPEEDAAAEEETVPDYPVTVFFTREGYLKRSRPRACAPPVPTSSRRATRSCSRWRPATT